MGSGLQSCPQPPGEYPLSAVLQGHSTDVSRTFGVSHIPVLAIGVHVLLEGLALEINQN